MTSSPQINPRRIVIPTLPRPPRITSRSARNASAPAASVTAMDTAGPGRPLPSSASEP